MSNFWEELLALSGTWLQFTTAYHPQTDGQTEVTNRGLEQYLRAFTFDRPKRWSALLPWAELALNCSHHASIGTTPFTALYGRDPPNLFATPVAAARNQSVTDMLAERSDTLTTLKRHFKHAQLVMTDQANRHRRHVEYNIGDLVLLKLQPYRQHSVSRPIAQKLARRFYGPYKVVERIGKVAYRLQLPAESRIHDVFHVSLLRPFIPPMSETASQSLPETFRRNSPIDVPVRASEERRVLVDGTPQLQWLVYWSSHPTSHPSWEPRDELMRHFSDLRLEDKPISMRGGVDTASTITTVPSATGDHRTSPLVEDGNIGGPQLKEAGPSRPRRTITKPKRYKDYSSK